MCYREQKFVYQNTTEDIDRRTALKGIVGATIVAPFAGCMSDPGVEDGSLNVTICQGNSATTLDPHNHSNPETYDAHRAIYEKLGFIDREGETHPWLAEDWERIDETTMKFYIREGVLFHSGNEMTPEDVQYSLRRLRDDDVGYVSPQRDSYQNITEIEIDDADNAVLVTTDGPDAILEIDLFAGARIVEQEFLENRTEAEASGEANGTGPYIVTDYQESDFLQLELWDEYWGWEYLEERGLPQADEVRFQNVPEDSTRASQIEAGEVEMATEISPPDFDRVRDQLVQYATDRSEYVKMKTVAEPFDSLEVRQAFNYAVNVEEMNETFFDGGAEEAGQPAPPSWIGHNPNIEPYPYDLDRAIELMEESPYAGEDIELELHTAVGNVSNDLNVTQAIAGYLRELPNVEVEVIERDFADIFGDLRGPIDDGRPDFYRSDTGGSPGEAIAGKLQRMHSTGGSGSAWEDEDVDELITQAGRAPDIETRAELAQEAAQLIHDRAPEIFLWWRPDAIATNDIVYEPFENQSTFAALIEDDR